MKNIIFAGVGGQGVILASKESEVHGMAQRGGSVDCNIRFGEKVYSPLIPKGGADFVVSLEMLESMRKLDYLSSDAVLIVNREQIDPAPVSIGAMKYPEDIESWLKSHFKNTIVVDTAEALKEAGTKKALNIVMLGALSKYLDFEIPLWEDAIKSLVKEKFIEQNLKAFHLGRDLV